MDERPTIRRGPLLWLAANLRYWQIGFLIGSALPFAFGGYWMFHEITYRASLPQAPNTAYCGMGMLGAWVMILFVGPICGTIGAAVGFVVSVTNRQTESEK